MQRAALVRADSMCITPLQEEHPESDGEDEENGILGKQVASSDSLGEPVKPGSNGSSDSPRIATVSASVSADDESIIGLNPLHGGLAGGVARV